jgi:hypothetical protein
MLVLLMAQVSRCAVVSLCPSDDDLQTAVYRRTNDAIPMIANELRGESADQVLLIHPTAITAIKDVHCDEGAPDVSDTVTCSFRVKYPSSVSYEIAVLTRRDGRWTIIDSMAVTRDTGNGGR